MERHAGLRGRKPTANPERYPKLRDHLATPLPAPTYPIDVSGGVTAWGMLGNGPDPTLTANNGQPVGDCTWAGRVHAAMAQAAIAQVAFTEPTSNAVVTGYLEYDHGQDVGCDIGQLLLDWFNGAIHDDVLAKPAGFVAVDLADADAAMAAFGALIIGVQLTDDADQLFEQGQAWTVANGEQPDPNDGHCIVKVKSDENGDTYVTWGADQAATKAWSKACVTDVYAVVTHEAAEKVGLDLAAVLAEISALGGHTDTEPVPPPPAAPPDHQDPDKAHDWVEEVATWFERHFLDR